MLGKFNAKIEKCLVVMKSYLLNAFLGSLDCPVLYKTFTIEGMNIIQYNPLSIHTKLANKLFSKNFLASVWSSFCFSFFFPVIKFGFDMGLVLPNVIKQYTRLFTFSIITHICTLEHVQQN